MSLKIFHTVNAGLYFHNNEHGLLIDGLHRAEGGFSATPPLLVEQLLSHTELFVQNVDLAFTHLHGDHFDPKLVRRFFDCNPRSSIYAPGLPMPCNPPQSLALGIERLSFGAFLLTTFSTTHDGASFANQPHRSFCLQTEDQQYIICGDAILNPLLAKQMQMFCSRKTNAVFLNVYQIASKSGIAFLQTIASERIFLYHLPFPGDDPYGYRKMAKSIVSRQAEFSEQCIQILEPMHYIIL